MKDYKQCDPVRSNLKYDGVNTFCKNGCFVCSLADMTDRDPVDVAATLRSNGLFTNGYINDSAKAASLLGLEYHGKTTVKPDYDCIGETNYFGGQHFFVVQKNGNLIDSLGKGIYYPIVSYRLFKRGDEMIPQDKVDGYLFNADGKLLWWCPDPETANKFLPNWGNQRPITDIIPQVVKEVIKEVPVEKIVEVVKPLTEKEIKTMCDEYCKEKIVPEPSGGFLGWLKGLLHIK